MHEFEKKSSQKLERVRGNEKCSSNLKKVHKFEKKIIDFEKSLPILNKKFINFKKVDRF